VNRSQVGQVVIGHYRSLKIIFLSLNIARTRYVLEFLPQLLNQVL
jgi:hypothetical protein